MLGFQITRCVCCHLRAIFGADNSLVYCWQCCPICLCVTGARGWGGWRVLCTEINANLEETITDLNHIEASVTQIERKPKMFPHISEVRVTLIKSLAAAC